MLAKVQEAPAALRRARERVKRHPRLGPVVQVVEEMAREWNDDRVRGLAAEVAFFGLLSLFPALVALAAALGSLEVVAGPDAAEQVRAQVVDFLRDVLTEEAGGVVDTVDELFREESPGLLTLGLLGALWASSRGFAAVMRAMAVVYDAEERRPWWQVRLLAVALSLGTVLVVAVVLVALVIGPLLGRGRDVAELVGLGQAFALAWTVLRVPAAVAVLVAWAATVFHIAPNHRTPWRWDLPGALLVAVLWVLESLAFRLYLGLSVGTNQVFGVLGGAIVALFWLYLLAVALLLGAELNGILAGRAGVQQQPGGAGRE